MRSSGIVSPVANAKRRSTKSDPAFGWIAWAATAEKLKAKFKPGKADVTPTKPGDRAMSPEEVYKHALPSVFVLGSVFPDKKKRGEWEHGRYGTAWAVTADGVLVTNWHLFELPK